MLYFMLLFPVTLNVNHKMAVENRIYSKFQQTISARIVSVVGPIYLT